MEATRIYVTQNDIDLSRKQRGAPSYNVCRECAVSEAVSRTLKHRVSWAFSTGHFIDENYQQVGPTQAIQVLPRYTGLLNEMVDAFDSENRENPTQTEGHLEPFNFAVTINRPLYVEVAP